MQRHSFAVLSALALTACGFISAQSPSVTPAPVQTTPAAATHDNAGDRVVSQVRIVRLSETQGVVQIDRATGQQEQAITNMPLITGTRLITGNGLAEVEFEDNSTLRLTPETEVQFVQLGRTATGATVTECRVLHGAVYVHLESTRDTRFFVDSGTSQLRVTPSTHLRLDMAASRPTVAILQGSAVLQTAAGTTLLTKKETVSLASAEDGAPQIQGKVARDSLDAWDKQESAYHQHFSQLASTGGPGYTFGSSDLQYYGSFVDMPGCGSMWRPYFADATWNPYGTGLWAWYGGAGYSWVSPYPWGWLPYHMGEWASCGAGGWGWRPGGQWRGLNNGPNPGRPGSPVRPATPMPGHPQLAVVGAHLLARSQADANGMFMIRNNSAAFGVPRGSLGDLGKLSTSVQHTPTGTVAVYGNAAVGLHGSALAESRSAGLATEESSRGSYSAAAAHSGWSSSSMGSASAGRGGAGASAAAGSSTGAGSSSGGGGGHH